MFFFFFFIFQTGIEKSKNRLFFLLLVLKKKLHWKNEKWLYFSFVILYSYSFLTIPQVYHTCHGNYKYKAVCSLWFFAYSRQFADFMTISMALQPNSEEIVYMAKIGLSSTAISAAVTHRYGGERGGFSLRSIRRFYWENDLNKVWCTSSFHLKNLTKSVCCHVLLSQTQTFAVTLNSQLLCLTVNLHL